MSKGLGVRIVWVVGVALACSDPTSVSLSDLGPVVSRDAVSFAPGSIPGSLVERLRAHRVVMLGETHFIREQDDLVFEIVQELHRYGFRQVLLEWPQMADFLLADFVTDGGLVPDWEPPRSLGGYLIDALRDLNRTLPPSEQIQVRGIDVNLSDYGGADAFRDLMGTVASGLADPGPLAGFVTGGYASPTSQRERLVELRRALSSEAAALRALWGERWFDLVTEMVEVEIVSVPVRALRDQHYDMSARLRENAMKRLVDLRIGEGTRSLVNVGSNHAQKSFLRGTEQEWLGDYLTHRSPASDGSVFVMTVVPAWIRPASGGVAENALLRSPEEEIFRLMHEVAPEERVFLALDDPVFADDGVTMNLEDTIYRCAPNKYYDALMVLPMANRVPSS